MSVSTQPTLDLDGLEQYLASMAPKYPGMPIPELQAFRESEEGKNLVGWIRQKFQKCKDLRATEEKQWNINLAFYNGNQWVQFYTDTNGITGRLGLPVSARNKERQTINRIKPVVRTEMAKFTSQKPSASVVPATDDDDDIQAAEAAEQVWISTAERRHLDEEYSDAIFWMCITGNGFIKTTWDPELKDPDDEAAVGDVRYGSVDPYKIFVPDLKLKDLQAQPFIFHAYAKPVEWLELHYEEALGDKKLNPTCKEASSIQEEAFARPHGTDEKAFDSCMLYEFWIKPGQSKKLPEGGMVVMIDDIIVEIHNQGMPFEHGEYPFAHFGHIKREGFYRGSIIEDLIDLQRDYNKLRSQIAESRKKMAKPQLTAQKGAVTAAKITNEIGVLIEYKAGMQAPVPLALQNVPQYVLQEVDLILRDIEDISGQHEVSKGQTPAGVTAATAIAYLQESDDSFMLPSFKGVEYGFSYVARHTLLLFVEFVDTERLIKITGKNDTFSTELLSGANIKRGTDIRIEPGSSLPESKAARQAYIMDLMVNGFVDPQEGLDILQIGSMRKLIDNLKNDKRQAQRENIKFKRLTEEVISQYEQEWASGLADMGMGADPMSGQIMDPTGQPMQPPLIIPVNDWDNHEVHIEEHNRFRCSQEFEKLSPTIKEAIQSHVRMHQEYLATGAGAPMPIDMSGDIPMGEPEGPVDSGAGAEPSATPEMTPGGMEDAEQGLA